MRLSYVVLVLVALAGPALAAGWSQENADAANQGRLDREGPGSLEEGTFTSLDEQVLAQVVEGPASLALAGTVGGTVAALDASGEIVWERELDAEIRTAPLWTGEHVVVLPRGDTAYAFTAAGETAWTLPVDNQRGAQVVRMASPVQHPGGDVIVATMAGQVHRVAPEGSTVWTAQIGEDEALEATPAITPDGDVIAAAFEPGREGHGLLARLDGGTGETEWETQIGAQVVGAPTVFADVVLVPLRDGEALEARSLSDGSREWELAFDDSITASPTIHEGKAIVGDIAGTLRAVDLSGPRVEWSFHPSEDDPEVDLLTGTPYTVADSVAVDGDDVAWTSYWVVDLSTCCPPEDSTESPIYRLDADDGELLDRRQYPKAHHGPSLSPTGVWAGSDEQGVRAWSTGPSLGVHAWAEEGRARLVTNTDRSGTWTIAWGEQAREEGQGRPPALSEQALDPGRHTITVTVADASATDTVTIPSENGDSPSAGDPPPDTGEEGESPAEGGPGSGDGEESPTSGEEAEAEGVSLVWILAPIALGAAAGVRSRA